MIKILSLILPICMLLSCKKNDFTFDKNEITETDINGNLIGNVNVNDWKLQPLSSASEFDKKVFNQVNIGTVPFDYKLYHSCDSVYEFKLIVYPNPVINSNCTIRFLFNTNISFKLSYLIIALRDGTVVMDGGNTDRLLPTQYNIPALVKKDYIVYYLFVTDDNCLYFGKGNVIGCTD